MINNLSFDRLRRPSPGGGTNGSMPPMASAGGTDGTDGTNGNDFAGSTSRAAWAPVTPSIPKSAIQVLAGQADAEAKTVSIAQATFDAANDGVACSPVMENHYRREAERENRHCERLDDEASQRPAVRWTLSKEKFGEQCGWRTATGWIALLFVLLLLTPIPLVVAQAIAKSFAFDAVSDDWRLGVPFGLPALAAITAAGLFRQTLGPKREQTYDRIIPALGVVSLAGWAAALAFTFLSTEAQPQGFGETAGPDLSLFYFAHLCLELLAALGLTAMAERSLTAGRKFTVIADEISEALMAMIVSSRQRSAADLLEAETIVDRRNRLAAARSAYVETCLGYLREVEIRRHAAMAQAGLSQAIH